MDDGDAHKRRALVVDDEPDIAEFVAEVMELEGFEVDYLTSVASAREHNLSGYSLVVLDLMMPAEDGADLLPALVECDHPPSIILMSGDVVGLMDQVSEAARSQGLNVLGCLRKPFFATDIEALLQ